MYRSDIDERWLSVYQAASLLKIAGRRFRSITYREWPGHSSYSSRLFCHYRRLNESGGGTINDIQGTLVAHLRTASSKTKFPRVFEDKPFPALWSALNAEIMNDDLAPMLTDVCSDTSSRMFTGQNYWLINQGNGVSFVMTWIRSSAKNIFPSMANFILNRIYLNGRTRS